MNGYEEKTLISGNHNDNLLCNTKFLQREWWQDNVKSGANLRVNLVNMLL